MKAPMIIQKQAHSVLPTPVPHPHAPENEAQAVETGKSNKETERGNKPATGKREGEDDKHRWKDTNTEELR